MPGPAGGKGLNKKQVIVCRSLLCINGYHMFVMRDAPIAEKEKEDNIS